MLPACRLRRRSRRHDRWLDLVADALKQDDPAAAVASLRSVDVRRHHHRAAVHRSTTPSTSARSASRDRAPSCAGRAPTATRAAGWDIRQVVDAAAGPGRALDELERGRRRCGSTSSAGPTSTPTRSARRCRRAARRGPVVLAAGVTGRGRPPRSPSRWSGLGVPPARRLARGRPVRDAGPPIAPERPRRRPRGGAVGGRLATDRRPGCGRSPSTARATTTPARRTPRSWATPSRPPSPRVRVMVDAGVIDPFGAIELRLAATADQFATIAKFRAVRRVWSRIAAACGAARRRRPHRRSTP